MPFLLLIFRKIVAIPLTALAFINLWILMLSGSESLSTAYGSLSFMCAFKQQRTRAARPEAYAVEKELPRTLSPAWVSVYLPGKRKSGYPNRVSLGGSSKMVAEPILITPFVCEEQIFTNANVRKAEFTTTLPNHQKAESSSRL